MEPIDTKPDDQVKENVKEKADSIIEIIQDFTDKLTLRRVLTALVAGLTTLALYTSYEYRANIFNAVVSGAPKSEDARDWTVTFSQQELDGLVSANELVKFVLVTQVDLRNNRRRPRYWKLDDPEVSIIKQKAAQLLPQAVFDYDDKNTQQMVAVLNNEFICTKFEDTIYMRHFPEMLTRMPFVCRAAIPPFYGRFVGILTFGLSRQPTQNELGALKLEASRLSIYIYINDVIKKNR